MRPCTVGTDNDVTLLLINHTNVRYNCVMISLQQKLYIILWIANMYETETIYILIENTSKGCKINYLSVSLRQFDEKLLASKLSLSRSAV